MPRVQNILAHLYCSFWILARALSGNITTTSTTWQLKKIHQSSVGIWKSLRYMYFRRPKLKTHVSALPSLTADMICEQALKRHYKQELSETFESPGARSNCPCREAERYMGEVDFCRVWGAGLPPVKKQKWISFNCFQTLSRFEAWQRHLSILGWRSLILCASLASTPQSGTFPAWPQSLRGDLPQVMFWWLQIISVYEYGAQWKWKWKMLSLFSKSAQYKCWPV